MLKKIILTIVVLLVVATGSYGVEIGGVELAETMKIGNEELVLNGYGLRKKFMFKVYAAGLYLLAKQTDNKAVHVANDPQVLLMKYRRGIPIQKIDSVFYESFAVSAGEPERDVYDATGKYGNVTKETVKFMGWLCQKDTEKNDEWIFKYTPGKGTDVYINRGGVEDHKGTIPGLDFKKVLFGIWLMDDAPVGSSLTEQLMGDV